MERLQGVGRRMLFWGALSLLIWAAYELSTRLDAMSRPLMMYYNMAVGEKVGLSAALKYVDWEILRTPGFLLGMLVLGLLALRSRSRPWLGLVIVPLCVLAAVYSVGARVLFSPTLWSLLKLLPLVLIAAGSLINILFFRHLRANRRRVAEANQPGRRRFMP